MASNYDQNNASESLLDDAFASDNMHDERSILDEAQASSSEIHGGTTFAGRAASKLNDSQILRMRRVNSGQSSTKRDFEIMCEDKASRYKLEEAHCSLPSSSKSTFIMTFSPDGKRVASTHGDHRIYICDLTTGKLLDTLDGHPKTPWCLAWHPSNKDILASGCLAGEVRVWDLRSKACEVWASENNTIISSIDFHPKQRVLVIATSNAINFWDWSESEPFAKTTTTHDKEKVKFVEFDSSGTKLITGISNLPKFTGYSSDSLQNRIIDSYLNQGSFDQLPTENMTQNSEITGTPQSVPFSSRNINERDLTDRHTPQLPSLFSINNTNIGNTNEQEASYRCTMTLSRIAFLYRQLEALEDSMRHTSFAPYVSPHQFTQIGSRGDANINQTVTTVNSSQIINNSDRTANDISPTLEPQTSSQSRIDHASQRANPPTSSTTIFGSNLSEPSVVSFDELLAQLTLSPLSIDGQRINPATLIEQYPIETPTQSHYMMQYDSMNQVNQNFIRISKLMSSIRLYRQVVQQILTSNSGQGHFQPSQILTAQCSPRVSRHAPNLPIVFRNFSPENPSDMNASTRMHRSTDPILAIQFRNSARNVPLVTICKIDLLCARCVCIMRSQQLVEQGLFSTTDLDSSNQGSNSARTTTSLGQTIVGNINVDEPSNDNDAATPFYHLLSQLHQSLTGMNHAPLTTSNVHTHIVSVRSLISRLLDALSSMFSGRDDATRLTHLIHDIANNLTGRNWNIPLGATLDDIRLDVIHTLCIVDLTLHLARQVQLLQMQRLSASSRIEETRRTTTSSIENIGGNNPLMEHHSTQVVSALQDIPGPSTSREESRKDTGKRKIHRDQTSLDANTKRIKTDVDWSLKQKPDSSNEMIDNRSRTASPQILAASNSTNQRGLIVAPEQTSQPHANSPNPLAEHLSPERMLVWNNTQNPGAEHSLHRFLVAAASSMSQYNSHILVRIYSRLHGSQSASHNSIDRNSDQQIDPRRRALSQDNSLVADNQGFDVAHPNARVVGTARARPPPVVYPVNDLNGVSGGLALETWQRHPHLHVYQTRGSGPHLWFNQWTIPLPVSNSNYRIQCWNFSQSALPDIKDSKSNVVTQKCRIHNNSSIDISSDGFLIACLVPRDDGGCLSNFDLKVFSIRSSDFGACYHQIAHGPNAISVSLSPSASFAVVGLVPNKFMSSDGDNDVTIAKVSKLTSKQSEGCIRDIKIKRDDSSLSLNAIRWMSRGIVYNIGPKPFRYRSEIGAQQ